jgi:hypothetical protein
VRQLLLFEEKRRRVGDGDDDEYGDVGMDVLITVAACLCS